METNLVKDYMTTISPTDTLQNAVKIMLENQISALPVLDQGKLVGIITDRDILRALVELLT